MLCPPFECALRAAVFTTRREEPRDLGGFRGDLYRFLPRTLRASLQRASV
jgi:hypothetical protein